MKNNLIDYLKNLNNAEGKLIFDRWIRKKQRESELQTTHTSHDFEQMQRKMKLKIDARIKEEETAQHPSLPQLKPHQGIRLTSVVFSLKIAATIAVLLVTTILMIRFYDPAVTAVISVLNPSVEEVYETITAKRGSKARFTLTDGTSIVLNAGSQIRFSPQFSQDKRELFLTGQAYFKVAKDKNRPFIVHAGNLSTTVIGTAFGIKAFENENDAMVLVEEGKVKVNITQKTRSDNGQATDYFLKKDEQVTYRKLENEVYQQKVSDGSLLLAWKDNVLAFEDQSLEEIAKVLERWFDVQISFGNENLKMCTFRGRSKNPKLWNILESISYANDITYEKEGKNIVFKGPGCHDMMH